MPDQTKTTKANDNETLTHSGCGGSISETTANQADIEASWEQEWNLDYLPHLQARVAAFFASFPEDHVFTGGGHEMLIHDLSVMITRLENKLDSR